jgi:hypothetical protein
MGGRGIGHVHKEIRLRRAGSLIWLALPSSLFSFLLFQYGLKTKGFLIFFSRRSFALKRKTMVSLSSLVDPDPEIFYWSDPDNLSRVSK